MFSFRTLAALAVMVGLLVAPNAGAAPHPVAGAAGGDVASLVFPSVVNVPFVRTRAALDRAVEYTDTAGGDATITAKAVASLAVVRAQLKKAWVGEKYLIDNAPTPVVADDLRAELSGAPVATSPFASAEDSGGELFNLYHEVATVSVALSAGAKGPLQSALSTTVFAALNQRDAAIAYIHLKAPPPPPADLRAGASGAPIAAGWSGVMPGVADLLDDELQQLDSILEIKTLSDGAKRVFKSATLQDTKTQKTINTWWPPLPLGD
jgi:hypothetical protein